MFVCNLGLVRISHVFFDDGFLVLLGRALFWCVSVECVGLVLGSDVSLLEWLFLAWIAGRVLIREE